MLELENLLETFTRLMNDNYDKLFQGYPCFPKFSIWRLMTKIWMKEVFERANMSQSLTESFMRVISNVRENNVKNSLNNNSYQNNMNEFKEIPKCLYINYNTKKK